MVYFAVSANHRIKLKESENTVKDLDLPREPKKLWDMKAMVIPIVISELGTITKWLGQELENLEKKSMGGYYPNNSIIKIG